MSRLSKTPEQTHAILRRELENIAPEADLSQLDNDADIREELDIDSFDFVRYIAAVCDALELDVPELDYIEFTTLARAEKYLGTLG
ncbi:hypothetical protein GCM10009104_05730 [Marinobacterium maritimum]|uniref:Carrier domain-containing protein n=1 Tax=Marinobacterium maritimum TaxID=500162 RepID=A0ABN1I3D0_9GAMM